MTLVAPRTEATERLASILPDRDRIVVQADPAVRDVVCQIATRFSIGTTWVDVDALPGEDLAGWRAVDGTALRGLADRWISLGAPVHRISDYLAIAMLRVARAEILVRLTRERRRLRLVHMAVHAACGGLVILLGTLAVAFSLAGLADGGAMAASLAATLIVWCVAALAVAGRRRMFESRGAALIGLFVSRLERAAVELEEQRADRGVIMRRLRALDDRERLPSQLWPLLGAPEDSPLWARDSLNGRP